jgi:hypothetical protein
VTHEILDYGWTRDVKCGPSTPNAQAHCSGDPNNPVACTWAEANSSHAVNNRPFTCSPVGCNGAGGPGC